MNVEKFEADLSTLVRRFTEESSMGQKEKPSEKTQFIRVKESLVELYKKNLVKINHSALELLCARSLFRDYDCKIVEVEFVLNENLVCDVYGKRADTGERIIVEIETGYVSPEYALEPTRYCCARIASKIARYSNFADKFILAAPPTYLLTIPKIFLLEPHLRTGNRKDTREVKELCDRYYRKPPVSMAEILAAKLDSILIVDVDRGRVNTIGPEKYVEAAKNLLRIPSSSSSSSDLLELEK